MKSVLVLLTQRGRAVQETLPVVDELRRSGLRVVLGTEAVRLVRARHARVARDPSIRPRRQAGRPGPYWGKLHGLGAEDVARIYPGADAFHRVRQELDPEGRLQNEYLARILPVCNGRA